MTEIRLKIGIKNEAGGGEFTDTVSSDMVAFYLIGSYSAGGYLIEIEEVE